MNEYIQVILIMWALAVIIFVGLEVANRVWERIKYTRLGDILATIAGIIIAIVILVSLILMLPVTLYLIWKGEIEIERR